MLSAHVTCVVPPEVAAALCIVFTCNILLVSYNKEKLNSRVQLGLRPCQAIPMGKDEEGNALAEETFG